jgi:hypothetical protein
MNKLIWLMIFAGILLGPVYYLYARYASGSVVQKHVLRGRDTTSDGRLAKPSWHSDIKMELSPAMNPIAFDLDHGGDLPPGLKLGSRIVSTYRATLLLEGKQVWSQTWHYGFEGKNLRKNRAPSPIHDDRLRQFNVSRSGEYTFQFTPEKENEALNIRRLTLEVVRNAAMVNMTVVTLGIALLALGAGIGFYRMQKATV